MTLKTNQTKWHDLPRQNRGQKSCMGQPCITLIYQSVCLNDYRVRTEENCEDDCRVLNERKLVGCPTFVPGLMKYRL